MTLAEAAVFAKAYAAEARFDATCARLRAAPPVVRVEADGCAPFGGPKPLPIRHAITTAR